MNKILVIGSANTDMVVQCPHLPQPGETVLGGTFVSVQGGKGANQAVAAARLGGKVAFACRVGNDDLGAANIEAYRAEGIDTQFIVRDSETASGVALIAVDDTGENLIAVASGANAKLTAEDIQPAIDSLDTGDLVLLQLEIPIDTVMHAVRTARQKGATVILDPAPAPSQGLPGEMYSYLDYILPNEIEAQALSDMAGDPEQSARWLHNQGTAHTIVTMGEKGILLCIGKDIQHIGSQTVEAVDSTAAGDAFAGALSVALSESQTLYQSIEWAQHAAAISVTRAGAQPSLPHRSEIQSG